MKFFLFDIDGTLIDAGGAGTRALNMAFTERFTVDLAFEGISMAGRTDIQIINDALGKHGLPQDNGFLPPFLSSYLKHLAVEMNNNRKHIKPGVITVLELLSKKEGCVMGILTGNIKDGAIIKLDAFGLTGYFGLVNDNGASPIGAFGSDNEDRSKLLPVAVKRLREAGIDVRYSDCVVIGDTPLDVKCSKLYGAVSVAVATGPYSMEQLRESKPDILLADLSSPEPLLDLLG